MKKIIAFTLTGVLLFTSGLTVYARQKGYNPKAKTEMTTTSQEGIKEQTQTNEQTRDKNQISLSVKEFKGKISIKGKKVNFDILPVLKGDKILIPVRAIMNGFGAEVYWDPQTQTVTISKDNITIKIIIGESKVYVNGKEETIDVPATLVNSRTLVPLRFILETFNKNVNYDKKTGDVDIEDKNNNTVTNDVYGNTNSTVTNSVYGQ
ncbi:copper amine oxidase N-terminal domain-containing protein [Aceticella autotrophica]|uniref:Copper amine oxidase N-terminal domain-containing protein n=1 Tax=Aceticella autotrophica TaxID=2755338 RepID=A0A975G9V3_9THEO|nr:copper amine oxidase N-terminal domain-containing protein [Aceticella autotrophica]QSZ26696.1 copper amine oxidase N-terminal domain-containing protein [Aceticella autotrophica]